MKLETKRLFLREMTENDFEALYRVLADSDIMRHYPYTFDERRVRNWIVKNIERYETFGFGLWAVCLKETGEMIGDCGVTMQLIDGVIRPEIGYHIAKAHQRRGYAREAATACRDWVFEQTPFGRVFSYMEKDNLPSAATAMSAGLRFFSAYKDGEEGEKHVYCLTRDEWTELKRLAQEK